MRDLTAEQLKAVQEVVDAVVPEALVELDVTIAWMEALLGRVNAFLVNDVRVRAPVPNFTLRVRKDVRGAQPLSIEWIQRAAAVDSGLFEVDGDLAVISTKPGGQSISESSIRTRKDGGVEVFVENLRALFIVRGCIVREFNLCYPGVPVYVGAPTRGTMDRFPILVEDHYHMVLRWERGTSYWKDKGNRVLASSPDTTEFIFQRSLLRWLEENVYNRLRVYAEPSGLGQDKTDIVVVTASGAYVIEVKWLGVNEHHTRYARGRIDEGLRQVGIYLDNDPAIISGFLVCYDGRSWESHCTEQTYDPTTMHKDCAQPIVQFLESETPSTLAGAGTGARRRR